MNTTSLQRAIVLLLAAPFGLAACGGGSGGVVRSDPPSTPSAPTPSTAPTPSAFDPCPAPITSDCVVALAQDQWENLPQAQSDFSLVLRGGELGLVAEDYRFGGGTRIETGLLVVGGGRTGGNENTRLRSDVTIDAPGNLFVVATVVGNVANAGGLTLLGTIQGNLTNAGQLRVDAAQYGNPIAITGDFAQTSAGTLSFGLAPAGWDSPAPLDIGGEARLAGALLLREYTDAWAPYPLPVPGAHKILHADGGVFGAFDQWTSPGLFIEGSLRYEANDVWFDLTRISLQSAMRGQGAVGGTLASAAAVDRALAAADGFAAAPTAAQRQFLRAAAQLLWTADARTAGRALDSLMAPVHALALERAMSASAGPGLPAASRLARLQPGLAAGAWSSPAGDGAGRGFDAWLRPRLLVGGVAGRADVQLADARGSGSGSGSGARASAYARWFGDGGWYAGGSAGFARQWLALARPVDLGRSAATARSQRRYDVVDLAAEGGRRLPFAGGRLEPHLGLGATAARAAGARELGGTGFELALADRRVARLDARAGARYARDWGSAAGGWLRLDAELGVRRRLAQAGDAQRAAFLGVPDIGFDLPDAAPARAAWFGLGLHGGGPRAWQWSMGYRRDLQGVDARRWWLGLERPF